MKKRLLTIALVFCMVISLAPAASAEGSAYVTASANEDTAFKLQVMHYFQKEEFFFDSFADAVSASVNGFLVEESNDTYYLGPDENPGEGLIVDKAYQDSWKEGFPVIIDHPSNVYSVTIPEDINIDSEVHFIVCETGNWNKNQYYVDFTGQITIEAGGALIQDYTTAKCNAKVTLSKPIVVKSGGSLSLKRAGSNEALETSWNMAEGAAGPVIIVEEGGTLAMRDLFVGNNNSDEVSIECAGTLNIEPYTYSAAELPVIELKNGGVLNIAASDHGSYDIEKVLVGSGASATVNSADIATLILEDGAVGTIGTAEVENIVVESGAEVVLGEGFSETQTAFELPAGASVTTNGNKYTARASGSVDAAGNLMLPGGAAMADGTSLPANTIVTAAGVIVSGNSEMPTLSENGTIVVPESGGSITTADGEKIDMPAGGSVDADGTVHATPTWTVTVSYGNGMPDMIVNVIRDGGTITLPTPTNSGYIFLGWRSGDTTYKAGDVVPITGNTTFVAVWGNLPDVKPSEPETPETPVFPFYDVSARDWYYSAVKYVYEKGLMDGVDVGVFAPNDTLTRAMVWTIIARAEGVDTTGGATWYAKAQEWVTAKGISDGENPNAAITRQELVTMLYRLAGEPAVSGTITAPDASSVSTWAQNAMTWAMNIGLVEGDENGAVTPTATATRAQAAALIMRYLEA